MFDLILISPRNTQLRRFTRFVPRSVPVGVGILAGYLREKGIAARVLDEEIIDINAHTLETFLEKCEKPRIVGISCMTTNVSRGYRIAELIKSVDKEVKVVFGGIHTTAMTEEVLGQKEIDFAIKGEGDYSLLELVRQIKRSNKIEPEKLENIAFKENGKIIYTKSSEGMVDVNELPMFPYDIFDISRYNLGFILSSRGCPFDCIFCSQRLITKRIYRYVTAEKVIGELDYLVNELHQPNITFFDDYFTGNKKRVFELCEMIQRRGFHKKASFFVQTRGDSIDKELMVAMRAANFDCLMFGVETASEDLMKLINKNETVQENIDAIRLAKEMGFTVEATFIFGFPTETFSDRFAALSLAQEMRVDRARFNNATPYPGTKLYEMVKEKGMLRVEPGWENFSSAGAVTAGVGEKYSLPYVPEGCTEKELAGTILLANLLFYLNFPKIKNLFNPGQKGSGKWFELPLRKLVSPRVLFDLTLLGVTIFSRSIYYLISCNKCRKFFFKGIRAMPFPHRSA